MNRRMFVSAVVVVVLVAASSLWAAGQKESAATATQNIVLTEMDYWTSDPGDSAMKNYISAFEAAHPGMRVERNAVPFANELSKALTEAAAHTLPDILTLDNPNLQAFASTGALASLDSFTSIDKSQYYPGPLSTVTYNGKLYGLPIGNNDLAIIYNKKMLSNAGVTPPTTWDELLSAAKALTKGNTYGFAFNGSADEGLTWQFEPWLWSAGGSLRHLDSAESISALNLWVTLVNNGWTSKSVLNWGQDQVEQQFENGYAAMEEMGPWMLGALQKSGIDFGIAPIPVPKAGMKPIGPLGGEVFTIPVSTQTKEKQAWEFINWMQQPDNLIAINKAFSYIPAYIPAAKTLVASNPLLSVFADELNTGRARTLNLGANYPKVSQIVWSAVQSALAGTASPEAAFKAAQKQVDAIINQ